jgi:hypothetical protein
MGCDASFAHADHGMMAGEPTNGRAAAAWLTLVARLVGVVEIRAACALKQVSRGRCLIAQLPRGTGQQCAGEQAIITPNTLVGGKIGVAHQGSNAQPALGCRFNLVERETIHVDQMGRRFDLELHQVEQVGATRNELGTRNASGRRCGLSGRVGALKGEGLHAFLPATSVIASTMLE